jgi:hypothetical protein
MNLDQYLTRLQHRERRLADTYRQTAAAHPGEPDIAQLCARFARDCDQHVGGLPRAADGTEPALPVRTSYGDLLDDLEYLLLLAGQIEMGWTLAGQAAQANRDRDLRAITDAGQRATARQIAWLRTRLKQAAAQALTVTPDVKG